MNIEITVINNSSSVIKELRIVEPRFKNSKDFKNIKPDDVINYSLVAKGEMTYKISVNFDSTKTLETEVYSEPGYKDNFIVMNDTIIYKTNLRY